MSDDSGPSRALIAIITRDPISESRHETITFDWFFGFEQLPPVFEFQYSYYVYMLQEKRV